MKIGFAAAVLAAALLASTGAPSAANELRVNGAATIARAIIQTNQAAIEQESGVRLVLTVDRDGNGLKDLYAGRADVAMIAAPIKATGDVLNKASPGSISLDGMEVAPVGSATIRFVVNPRNPVRALSPSQVHDILIGKISSWKEVGGDDIPIVVVAETPGFGTHTNIVATFLDGMEFAPGARLLQALVQLVQVTAQVPGAISYGNAASINDTVAVVSGTEVRQDLGMVTKGKPGADTLRLIEAVAKYGANAK